MTSKKTPLVITIIIHYNAIDECLQITKDLLTIDYCNHHIIVVDNPSTNDVYSELKTQLSFPSVHLVRNTSNNGYGGGINFGINYAKTLKASYFHIINTDTRIESKHYISNLVDIFERDPSIGLIGPGVLTTKNVVQNTIMSFVTVTNAIFFKQKQTSGSILETQPRLYPVEVINGVCFMVSSEAFFNINGFDEDFFMYGEEHDLCFKLKEAGYTCHFWSERAIMHMEGNKADLKTFTWREALVRINQVLYLKKREKRFQALILGILFSIAITMKRIRAFNFSGTTYLSTTLGLFRPVEFNRQLKNEFNK